MFYYFSTEARCVVIFGALTTRRFTLILRSRKGRRTPWSRVTRFSFSATSAELNHESKSSAELNTSGSRKLSSAHSSCKLFWSGVPVSSRRFVDLNSRTTIDSFDFSFFILMKSTAGRKESNSQQRFYTATSLTRKYKYVFNILLSR